MNPAVPTVISSQVSDPDLLAAGIRGASLEACQLSRPGGPSTLSRIAWQGLCLDQAHLRSAMLFSGATPCDCFTLIFVLACPEVGHSFNFEVEHTDGYLGFFPPGSPIDASTPVGYANATITVPVAEFSAALAKYFPEIPDQILARGAGMRVGPTAQASLRALLGAIDQVFLNGKDSFAAGNARLQIESQLLALFLSALRNGCENLAPPASSRVGGRLRRLREARDYLAAHLQQPLYLNDLCTALALSPRAVENLFRDLLGISPIAYLHHLRLHGVHRALKATDLASGAVKERALEWGFWHLGRFSRDYRAFFGESPSQTLGHRGR